MPGWRPSSIHVGLYGAIKAVSSAELAESDDRVDEIGDTDLDMGVGEVGGAPPTVLREEIEVNGTDADRGWFAAYAAAVDEMLGAQAKHAAGRVSVASAVDTPHRTGRFSWCARGGLRPGRGTRADGRLVSWGCDAGGRWLGCPRL